MNNKDLLSAVDLYLKHGSLKAASEASGIPSSTIGDRIKSAKSKNIIPSRKLKNLNKMSGKSSITEDETLVRKAVELFRQVETKAEVARLMEISTDSVYKLFEKARQLGIYD